MNAISRPARSDVAVRSSLAVAEARRLVRLADEGPHDPDAGDLLAQHLVDPVDALLHRAGTAGPSATTTEPDADDQRRDARRAGSARAAASSRRAMNDAADDRDRRGDQQRAGHQHEHLHLLHVVGDAGDQRRRAELADLPGREAGDRWNRPPRTSRPKPIAARAPK